MSEATTGLTYAAPKDYENPDFEKAGRVHDWRNYVFEDLQAHWPELSLRHRAVIAANLQAIADREDWD